MQLVHADEPVVVEVLPQKGVIVSNSKSRAVTEQKIDEFTRRVEKRNCLVERTYQLERGDAR